MKTIVQLSLNKPLFVIVLFVVIIALAQAAPSGKSVMDDWDSVKAPARPSLKAALVDPSATALLLLDFNKQTCNTERRPRCIASIPDVKKFLDLARAKKMPVIYSLSPGANSGDIARDLSPRPGEPVVTSGPDKFLGTDLEKILRAKNIKTVIVTGTAAHGAVLHTASGAALRGFSVILPVDGLSAETLYPEQYAVWHLLNAPRISAVSIASRLDMITIK